MLETYFKWFFWIASLVFLVVGVIGMVAGVSMDDNTLKYISIVCFILATYCEISAVEYLVKP